MAATTHVHADDLEIIISGVEGPVLVNVGAFVSPLRFTGTGRLTSRRLEQLRLESEQDARLALRPFGYYHSTVQSSVTKTGDRAWRMDVKIEPGPPLLITHSTLELAGPGADLTELREWRSAWPLSVGKTLVQPSWEEQKEQALEISADNGYLLAEFSRSSMEADLETNQARLDLVLDTGEQAVMGEVRFHQDLVRPYIMENLPRFRPGDPYNAWIMERFRVDLWRVGYFHNIEVIEDRQLDASPPRVDLDVRLEPRPPNTYQGTIGVGSDTGPRVLFNWNRHHLTDRGDSFSLGTGWQEHNNEFLIRGNYRIPRNTRTRQFWISEALLKRENEDLKVRDIASEDQTLFNLGKVNIDDYAFRAGHMRVHDRKKGFRQLFETLYAEYLYEKLDFNPKIGDEGIPPEVMAVFGESDLSSDVTTLSLGIDLDMPFTRGAGFDAVGVHHRTWAFVSNEAWTSDVDFVQVYLSSRWIHRAGERWKFLLRGEAGYTDADVEEILVPVEDLLVNVSVTHLPNYYRFKAGGSTSVRGYDFESLSDSNTGSNNIFTASAEVEYRVFGDWSLAAFYDVGNAFNSWSDPDLKQGVGVGIRWYSIAGAVRVDYAKALDLPGEPWQIHFTIGASVL
ncbi:MAG: autotransporter assembly complex protein TamA [Thiogranum sp.]